MTASEVLETVASMPREDWLKIQHGIADLLTAQLSANEAAQIRDALAEADGEFARGDALTGADLRRQLGIS